ncbi:hypothetical protein H3Z83_04070 [Tenacibaculum sp. S7007]|uniref:Uncharacterized protein n=1 Tax=Tenacibaculum pelagium TaxID=2759527 RepID=A0A839AMV3_9FLAO|nr:hypothetical protein [Tenacibaculum pelagium]MBA6155700.1 hypothetical protein [Tenacibaculum pelagium]
MFLKQILNTVKKQSPILFGIVLIHFVFILISLIGLFIDDRSLMGVNVWTKPLKFSVSGGIYILTIGYFITLYPFSKRKKDILNNIVSWTMLIEFGIIIYQASRGVQSHYNKDTNFDALLFAGMGLMVLINFFIMLFFIFETIRLKLRTTRSIQFAILLGWIIIVVGSWIGQQMINQMSHNVGIADGGAGLPLVNWSTIAGDLRVAHFFGLHGLQIIPLFALWLSNKWKAANKYQIITVFAFGLIYSSWIGYTFYQAKQAIPLINL